MAIKVIDISHYGDCKEIVREIDILKECVCPQILSIYDDFIIKGTLFIILKYMAGGSVRNILKSKGPLKDVHSAIFLREVVAGLNYLHSNHKMHRDVKSSNILISANGEVKLADFGVSAKLTEATKRSS